MSEISTLPLNEDLIKLPLADREYLAARVAAERRRRKRAAIEASIGLPDPIQWGEENFLDAQKVNIYQGNFNNAQRIKFEEHQARITRHVLAVNPRTGQFPYTTVVYSCPKKSGKSTWGSFAASYYARFIDPPNAVYIVANDREQASGRVYAFARPTLMMLGASKDGPHRMILPNGTVVQALTSDPDKEAGGSYGMTLWDELWAFSSARSRLLFEELMPLATRERSLRVITTYAGFEDKSDLLLQFFLSVFKDTSERELTPEARPVEALKDIVTTDADGNIIPCCYEVPHLGLFYYNDHEQRMVWQKGERGKQLFRETEATFTPESTFRLLYNRWQLTESRFLEPEYINAAVKEPFRTQPMTFAIDASEKHDWCALVGTFDECIVDHIRYKTGYAKGWNPEGVGIDIEATVIAELLRLFRSGMISRRSVGPGESKIVQDEHLIPIDVHYDKFQMHQVAMNLRKNFKLLMREFPQGNERLMSDSFLKKQYEDYNIDIHGDYAGHLVQHLKAAKGQEQTVKGKEGQDESKVRIVKGEGIHAKPIDLAVAQSMSVYRCSQRPRRIGYSGIVQGVAKGWQAGGRRR